MFIYIYIEKKMIHKSEGTLFSDKPAAKKIHGFFRERSKKVLAVSGSIHIYAIYNNLLQGNLYFTYENHLKRRAAVKSLLY